MTIKLIDVNTGLILSLFEMRLVDTTIRGNDIGVYDTDIKCNVAHFISVKGDNIYVRASAEDINSAIAMATAMEIGELEVSLDDYIINPKSDRYVIELASKSVSKTPGFDGAIASMLGGDIIQ